MEDNTIAEVLRDVLEGQETVFDVAEGGKSLKIERRKLQPELPNLERMESPPRAHTLHTADAVVDYVKAYGGDRTVVLLDAPHLCGKVVLNEEAEGQREVLDFTPQLHPLFKEWLAVLGKKTNILAFAEFAMSHRRQIVSPDGRIVALMFAQMRADKQVQIAQGQGKTSINGIMVTTTIQGQVTNEFVDIPDSITIRVPLFVGQEERQMEIDVTVGESNDQLWILCSASGVEEAKFADFDDMATQIREGVGGTDTIVVLGSYGTGKWEYLKA